MEMYTYKINLIVTTKISADNSKYMYEYKSVWIIVHVVIYGYDA